MSKKNVIVVQQNKGFAKRLRYEEIVYINIGKRKPHLKKTDRDIKYVAPYLFEEKEKGVRRLYHILEQDWKHDGGKTLRLKLGNSFVLDSIWKDKKNQKNYGYHKLKNFGFKEIKDGFLDKL